MYAAYVSLVFFIFLYISDHIKYYHHLTTSFTLLVKGKIFIIWSQKFTSTCTYINIWKRIILYANIHIILLIFDACNESHFSNVKFYVHTETGCVIIRYFIIIKRIYNIINFHQIYYLLYVHIYRHLGT